MRKVKFSSGGYYYDFETNTLHMTHRFSMKASDNAFSQSENPRWSTEAAQIPIHYLRQNGGVYRLPTQCRWTHEAVQDGQGRIPQSEESAKVCWWLVQEHIPRFRQISPCILTAIWFMAVPQRNRRFFYILGVDFGKCKDMTIFDTALCP